MAVTTELITRLENDSEPLSKRLCLAQNMFLTPLLPVQRKEEIVLSWLGKVAGKVRKKSQRKSLSDSSGDVLKLWSTVQLCISSAHLQRLGAADIRPSTKVHIIKVISKHLERDDLPQAEHVSLLECALSILEASSFQRYFRTNITLCFKFVSLLLSSLANIGPNYITLCLKSVSAIQSISRQTVLRNELCLTFLDVVLLPLIKLLNTQGKQPTSLSTEIYRCIQQVLFPKTSHDFSRFFLDIFKENKNIADPTANLPCSEEVHPIPLKLFNVLRESESILDHDSYVSLYSTIFRSYVASYKSNSGPMVFKMAVTLCYVNGFEVKNPKCNVPYTKLKNSVKRLDRDLSLLSISVLHGMVFVLAQWGVSLNGEIYGTRFLDWLQMLVEGLFPLPATLTPELHFLELISTLIKLNPLIIEASVKNLLGAITALPLSDTDKPAYSVLICNLQAMYRKLSRVPTFVTVFLEALKVGFGKQREHGQVPSGGEVWIPNQLKDELTRCAELMPSSSSIATLKTLLDQLLKNCLEPYQQAMDQPLDGFLEVFTYSVSELLCAFLKGVRLLEQSIVPNARQGFCTIMKELGSCLRSFGQLLLRLEKPDLLLLSSFVNLSYHWAAEALLIEQYAEVGRDDLLVSVGTQLSAGYTNMEECGSLSYLCPYLSGNEWASVCAQLEDCQGDRLKELILKLDFQLLSALRMFSPSQSNICKQVAKRCCAQMVQRFHNAGSTSLDQSDVVHVTLMAPVLDINELSTLSCSLVNCLLTNTSETSNKECVFVLLEERSVACALICATMSSLKRVLKTTKRKSDAAASGKQWKLAKEVLGKFDAQIIMQAEVESASHSSDQVSSLLSSVADLTNTSLDVINEDRDLIIGKGCDLSAVMKHLELLQVLPLPYLSGSSQAVVFLGLLSVALDCNNFPNSEEKDGVLKKIYDCLLPGLLERGPKLGPNLEGYINYGLLISSLAHVTVKYNLGNGLLESLLAQTLRQEQSQDQVLEKIMLLDKKARKQAPGKESLMLATLLMQDLSSKRLRMSTNQSIIKLRKARKKLAKSFESLIENDLVLPDEVLQAYALTIDFNLKFDKSVNSLTPQLAKFCKKAITSLGSDNPSEQKASESFILVVLRHRNKLQEMLPEDFIKDVWSFLVSSPQTRNTLVTVVFESASQEEMSFIINDLLQTTEDTYGHVNSGEECVVKYSSNIILFWKILLDCQNLPAVNYEIGWKAIRSLLERLHTLRSLSHQHLLGFLHTTILSSKLTMDMEMVDLCLLLLHGITFPQTAKEFSLVAQQYLSVLSALLLHRSSLALDSIPSFLQALQLLLKQLASESKQRPDLSRADAAQLAGLAFGAEKLVNAFTKPDKKKSFKRVAAYLIADFVAIFETTTLCSAVKVHYQNMVFALLSIVDEYSIKFLLRTMSQASTEIFKTLYDTYKKYHRFTGKV